MKNKIRDIVPPTGESEEEEVEYENPEPEKKGKGFKGAWLIVPLLLIGVVWVGINMAKAEIKIWPNTEKVFFNSKVTVDTGLSESDLENKLLAGQLFEITNEYSQSFTATGESVNKAEGTIRLYNAYTTDAETWRQGTRFMSEGGKVFKSKYQISVPGAKIKGGELEPQYVDVPVVAAEPGEEYNIGPSHFSVVAYKGTPRFTKFYGESLESMKGGGGTREVTEEDIEEAREEIIEKARQKTLESLRNDIPQGFVFLEDALSSKVKEVSCLAQAGDRVEKFNCKAEIENTTIGFPEDTINEFIQEFILSQIPEQQSLHQESIQSEYDSYAVDLEAGEVILNVEMSARTFSSLDRRSLKQVLVGKSLKEAKVFLENQPEIQRSEVNLWPFWVSSVPSDLERIKIEYPVFE